MIKAYLAAVVETLLLWLRARSPNWAPPRSKRGYRAVGAWR
ncbi:hypothetical protein [Amycolatopsis oliviviridis]|nr:hypothetical protein [Amycolatopsis oliviviridis]